MGYVLWRPYSDEFNTSEVNLSLAMFSVTFESFCVYKRTRVQEDGRKTSDKYTQFEHAHMSARQCDWCIRCWCLGRLFVLLPVLCASHTGEQTYVSVMATFNFAELFTGLL